MRNVPRCLAALLAFALVFAHAAPASAEIRKLRIEHYLQPNSSGSGGLCYVVSDGMVAQVLDEPIAGFTYQWGTVYQVTVNVQRAAAADGTVTTRYTLVSIDSQTRVAEGTRFQMYLFDRAFIQGKTILGQKAFTFATAAVEDELRRRLDNLAGRAVIPGAAVAGADPFGKVAKPVEETRRVILEFSHPKTAGEPLILHSVTGATDLGLE